MAESIAGKNIPGGAVAVWHDGAAAHRRGYGLANLEDVAPAIPGTVFRIGSLTKQFTAAAAIKLAAQGHLDLRAPVAEVLPAFRSLQPFSTLELMHQTAGLHSDETDAAPIEATIARSQLALAAAIAAQPKPFDFDPGSAWLYSNANYIVLGAVIEAVAKLPFAESMSRLIFTPLNLPSLACDTPAAIVPHRASGYGQTGDATAPFANAAYIDPSQAGGAGAMRGTAADLCLWHERLLGAQLFDSKHLALMLAPGRLRDGRLSGANRFNPDDAQYGETQYACGLLVTGPAESHPSVLHYGSINGFCGLLQTFIGKQVTLAVLCNTDLGPGIPFRAIRKAVIESYLG